MANIEQLPMRTKEIFLSYLKGWVVYPIIIFLPLFIAVREVYEMLNFPPDYYNWVVGLAITYLAVSVWILSARYEKRCIPQEQFILEEEIARKA